MKRLIAFTGLCVFVLVCGAQASICPDQISSFKKTSSAPVKLDNRALWNEYGFTEGETSEYADGARKLTVSLYRMGDPTAAFGVFEWMRPADAKPSKLTDAAAETSDGVLFAFGNYLIRMDGWKPDIKQLGIFLNFLPKLDQSPLPVKHLPAAGLVPNSERYVVGPNGLDQFDKGIPPAVAAFSMGAEAEIGEYANGANRMRMAIFSYPTPQIARQRLEAFQQVAGVAAKREGPLVAVIQSPADPNAAERLLDSVQYKATITVNERVPTRKDNVGDLMVNIFILVGIILAIIVPAGLLVGVLRRLGWGTSGDPMTLLHLEEPSSKQ